MICDAKVLVTLREAATKEEHKLIRETYLHSLMSGEILQTETRDQINISSFLRLGGRCCQFNKFYLKLSKQNLLGNKTLIPHRYVHGIIAVDRSAKSTIAFMYRAVIALQFLLRCPLLKLVCPARARASATPSILLVFLPLLILAYSFRPG